MRRRAALAAACAAALLAGAASAHDTWLEPRADTDRGERVLALGTGERFPAQQTAIAFELLQGPACVSLRDAGQRPWPLRWMADGDSATLLRSTRAVPRDELLDCRVPMAPLAITIAPDIVPVYLDEARADDALRERWRTLQSRGIAWTERYAKNARSLHGDAVLPGPVSAGAVDAGAAMPLDMRLVLPRWPLRVGDVLQGQLLRDGQPLAGHAVELRSDLSPAGLWRRTDVEGRFSVPLPLAARWLLRTIDLRPSSAAGFSWESRFFTLAFEVPAAPR